MKAFSLLLALGLSSLSMPAVAQQTCEKLIELHRIDSFTTDTALAWWVLGVADAVDLSAMRVEGSPEEYSRHVGGEMPVDCRNIMVQTAGNLRRTGPSPLNPPEVVARILEYCRVAENAKTTVLVAYLTRIAELRRDSAKP